MSGLPVYRGHFGEAQAERLLWRAGFGPRPGEARGLARHGLDGAVGRLVNPGRERLVGRAPQDDRNRRLHPKDAWGHDHLWWLDRMVRTSRPLVERMTLVWHDWFATSLAGVGSQRLMLLQNKLFRLQGLGSFEKLVLNVTHDPAMLLWLNGAQNTRYAPNENYGRELMELFTLGASRGYSERDVREQARALTGWRNSWSEGKGAYRFRFDAKLHDRGKKTIFGKHGNFDWKDSARLCVHHREHPSFFVRKLWSYFIPTPPPAATQRALERLYVGSGHQVRPVLAAILKHPALYTGPRMVKPPVVYTAGLLRILRGRIDTDAYVWLAELAGQRLFEPPNVSGWDDERWLNTSTFRGRWLTATYVLRPLALNENKYSGKLPTDPAKLLDRALKFWGRPPLGRATRQALLDFAKRGMAAANSDGEKKTYPVLVENALRHLIAITPEFQCA